MNRWIVLITALALLLCGSAALAENAATDVNAFIDEGGFVIQIPDPEGDLGWVADDMAQDDSVVKLYDADLIEDTFVVRYEPVDDGDMCVGVRHYTGIACDEVLTWDLRVADGAVREVIGGSHIASPDEAEQDPYLSGEWLEAETQFTQMTIEKNAELGWDVEIISPMTHGAYVFKTTLYYDCDLDSFVYSTGKYWDVPITDSEEEVELGDAKVADATGCFAFAGDGEDMLLTWHDDQHPEQEIVFERTSGDSADYPEIEEYVGTWYVDDYIMEIVHAEDDDALLNCTVTQYTGDREGVRWIYDACSYDDVGRALTSLETGEKLSCVFDDDYGLASSEQIFDDGAASFKINDDDTLTWTDFKETPGENERVFTKVVKDVPNPVAAFEGTWVCDRATLTIEDLDDVIYCTVRWASSASEETEWGYEAMYDEVADSLTTLETGVKTNRVYGDGGDVLSEEVEFDDGAASFKINDDDTLTWTDYKETPGANELVFERAQAE